MGSRYILLMAASTTCLSPPAAAAEEGSEPLCGAYTLYVGLKALDADVASFDNLQERLGEATSGGYSLGQLADTAESYGMHTLAVQTTLENLQRRPERFACIAHLDGNHFVNVADASEGIVSIVDPPREYTVPASTFQSQWDGTALLISPNPLLREEDLPRPFPWKWMIVGALGALLLYTAWVLLRAPRGLRRAAP